MGDAADDLTNASMEALAAHQLGECGNGEVCPFCQDEDDVGWLCSCGNWQEGGHCSECFAEPPWGCSCGCHEGDDGTGEELEWGVDVP